MDRPPDIAAEAERLVKLAVETGDDRLLRAAAVLADANASDFRRDWGGRGRRMRDDAIRDVAVRFMPEESTSYQAATIARRMASYASRAWLRHRNATTCPAAIDGAIEGALWAIWTAYKVETLSDRQLRRILTL